MLREHNRYCSASSLVDKEVERAVVEFDPVVVMGGDHGTIGLAM